MRYSAPSSTHPALPWIVLALLLAACALNFEEAQHQGFVYSAAQDAEDYNDKPAESYPGQYYWDGKEWQDSDEGYRP